MSEAIADVKPTVEAPPPEQKPAEDLDKGISEGLRAVLKDRLKGKPAPPKEEKPKAEDKPKEEKPKEEAKTEEKPKEEAKPKEEEEKPKSKVKVSRRPATPVVDSAKIVAEATAAATKAALEGQTVKRPGQAAKPLEAEIEALPEEYREDVPILKRMEEKWPDKYKGLTEKFIRSSTKIENYRTNWERQNPGQHFDPESTEHSAFIEANEVDWSDRDYGRALAAIETDEVMAKERKETKKKLEEVEDKLTEKELEPAIRQRQAMVSRELIEGLDKEYANMVLEDGRINRKEIDRLKEVDPVRVETLLGAASTTARFIDLAERIFHPSGRFQFDEKNQDHVDIAEFLIHHEDQIMSAGEEAQVTKDGRVFVTREDWVKMDPRQHRRHWRLEVADLVYLKQREQADQARKKLNQWDQQMEKMLTSRGYVKGDKPQPGTETKNEKAKEDKPALEKPKSPSATDSSKIDTSGGTGIKPDADFRTILKARLRGQTVT